MKMHGAMAALAVVVVMAVAQAASARNLSSTSAETPSGAIWSALRMEAGGMEATCPITLGGSLEVGSLVKRAGTRFGVVSEVRSGTCSRGAVTVLTETLPWAMTYTSFAGTLPNISSITVNLIGLAMRVELGGIGCLVRTESAQPARGIATLRREEFGDLLPTEIRADETATIGLTGEFFCSFAGRGHFAGTGTLSSGIAIHLI